ncbi:Vta1 like-domain-containing protein [Cytidiella melzeri]|nr:Vta1 like-domain-containing protein [Cytidiella melzeri]
MGILDLPPIPAELKQITPYLQRAEEVKATDPIIAYWCGCHAAQLGISLKLKDSNSRKFLFDLLGTLERMKAEIGPNDAIENESASSAYVENFALRVFSMADSEDRKGNATRGTAKKFLAAANFLEVLSVVSPSTPATTDVPEKIRYAKWKAADIAKAFREGRKPTPGGIGEQPATEGDEPSTSPKVEPATPSAIQRATSPPGPLADMPLSPLEPHMLPSSLADPKAGPVSPGGWSTIATAGTTTTNENFLPQLPNSSLRRAAVSEELEGTDEAFDPTLSRGTHEGLGLPEIPDRPHVSPASSDFSTKKVHFTPSVTGGLTPSTTQGHGNPFESVSAPPPPAHDKVLDEAVPSAPPLDAEFITPPGFVPFVNHSPSVHSVVPPTIQPFPVMSYPATQSVPPAIIPPPGVLSMDSTVTQTPEDLTPQLISRVQKHCRYAISSLDYEDAEQARKELRAALTLLGG